MIVGPLFDGDGHIDDRVMWRQHDVYYRALGIITNTCQEYLRLAHRLIGDLSTGWELISSYDHRTLQNSHDVLAAVWRFRHENEVRQMELPVVQMCREFLVCPYQTPRGDLNLSGLRGAWRCDIPKPRPRWDVHSPEAGNRAGNLAGVLRPLTAGPSGSGASPRLSG